MLELLSDNGKIILLLLGGILTVAGILLRQHLATLKELNREAVRKTYLDEKHRENSVVLTEIKTAVNQTQSQLEGLGEIKLRLATAEKDIQALRDFKHEACEPAVRYIGYLQQEKPWEESISRIEHASETRLERLETKMDTNEQKASDARHSLRNTAQVILSEIQNIKKPR